MNSLSEFQRHIYRSVAERHAKLSKDEVRVPADMPSVYFGNACSVCYLTRGASEVKKCAVTGDFITIVSQCSDTLIFVPLYVFFTPKSIRREKGGLWIFELHLTDTIYHRWKQCPVELEASMASLAASPAEAAEIAKALKAEDASNAAAEAPEDASNAAVEAPEDASNAAAEAPEDASNAAADTCMCGEASEREVSSRIFTFGCWEFEEGRDGSVTMSISGIPGKQFTRVFASEERGKLYKDWLVVLRTCWKNFHDAFND